MIESPHVAEEERDLLGICGQGSASTSGNAASISSHSLGLSSTRMKLSRPSSSSSASSARLTAFERQFNLQATK